MKLADLHLGHVEALLQTSGLSLPPRTVSSESAYLQQLLDALCELSSRDSLTGVANRRAFMSVLAQEIDRVARVGESALLLAVDIDHFKRINDTHGHLAGDMVIRAVARTLQACVRPMDTVARVGGEEFAVVLPSCPAAFGPVVAERIRAAVAETEVRHQALTLGVTVSCGGAYAPPWVRSSLEAWLERADRQLYLAKQAGRNRVCIEPSVVSDVSAEEKDLLYAWAQSDALMINPADAN
ncbi:GGDEF domain-containing protein [Aquabacterium sp. A08]|nr:GGDEF domain-containing protein [Aquabacterium sp. A08]